MKGFEYAGTVIQPDWWCYFCRKRKERYHCFEYDMQLGDSTLPPICDECLGQLVAQAWQAGARVDLLNDKPEMIGPKFEKPSPEWEEEVKRTRGLPGGAGPDLIHDPEDWL